jgi:hypothetical protein
MYLQKRIVLSTRHRSRARAGRCVCSNALHAPPFDYILLNSTSYSPPSCPHRAPTRCAPSPFPACAAPAPPPRISVSSAAPSAPPPCATTSSHANHPPHATARPPRRAAARFEPASGLLRAGAAPCWRRACWHNAPARFCTASRPDARSSSAPSALCRLSRRPGAARHGGHGGPRGTAACLLPPRACARPGACRAARHAERRDRGGLHAGDGPQARLWSGAGGRLRAVLVARWKGLCRAVLARKLTLCVPQVVHEAEACL